MAFLSPHVFSLIIHWGDSAEHGSKNRWNGQMWRAGHGHWGLAVTIMVAQDEKYSLLLAVFHDSLATKIFGGFSSIFFPFSAEGS